MEKEKLSEKKNGDTRLFKCKSVSVVYPGKLKKGFFLQCSMGVEDFLSSFEQSCFLSEMIVGTENQTPHPRGAVCASRASSWPSVGEIREQRWQLVSQGGTPLCVTRCGLSAVKISLSTLHFQISLHL